MNVCWKRLIHLSAVAACGAAWATVAAPTAPAGRSSAIVLAMGGGMMGGGMMGGYGPRSGYDASQRQGLPSLDSPGGRLYARTCARCHVLPDPRQHTAKQWPDVVARMERYIAQARQPLPDKDEINGIETFLAQDAKAGE
jgi:hypothetical protein